MRPALITSKTEAQSNISKEASHEIYHQPINRRKKVVTYLAGQPYREVAALIAEIQRDVKPVEEQPKAAEKEATTMTPLAIKNLVLAIIAAVGTGIATALGGWDMALQALLAVMAIDIVTGLLVALVWKKVRQICNGRG